MNGHWRKKMAIVLFAVFLLLFCFCSGFRLWTSVMLAPSETVEEDIFGMVLIDILDEEAAAFYHVSEMGLYVLAVNEDSAAYYSGVRSGDRIEGVDGIPVASANEFYGMLASESADRETAITFRRNGEGEPITVLLSQKTAE